MASQANIEDGVKKVSPETQNLRRPDLIEAEPVKKGYVPEGFDSAEAFIDDMRAEYQHDVDFDRINRFEAMDDLRFAAGEQWDPVVLQQRKSLPCLVINTIPQFTAQLVGDWRESRKAIKVIPSNNEDTDIASVREDLVRNIEMQSRADRSYDQAFESMIQCGDGDFKVSVEYSRDDVFDQDIYIRPIEDTMAVVWDRFSVDPTGRDARRVWVDDRIPKDEFSRKWPQAGGGSTLVDMDKVDRVTMAGWQDENSYRVTEYWRMIERQKTLALFANGKMYEMDDTNMESILEENGEPVKTRVAWCRYAQMHYCTGWAILAGPYEYRLNRLPIIRVSGRIVNVSGRRVRYGLVRFMKDPSRLKNFWRSIAAEQLGYAPKAQWLATQSAVEGRQDAFRKAHLTRDPLLIVNDEAIIGQNIQRIEPPAAQNAIFQEVAMNTQDMKDVSGIQDASLGMRSNETSGKAIMNRQHEGDVASQTYYDNADAALLEAGDVINQLIPQIYDGTRVIRLIGKDESIKFQRINDPMDPKSVDLGMGMFDVALSTGTSYTTRRAEAAEAMMDAIQVFPQLMEIAGDLVVKAQDWPGADELAERLQKTVPPQFLSPEDQAKLTPPPVPPQVVAQMQQQLQQLQQENQQLKTDKTLEFKKLEIQSYDAETKRISALNQDRGTESPDDMAALSKILDGAQKLDEHDIQRAQLEHSIVMDHAKLGLEKTKVNLQAQTEANKHELAKKASIRPTNPAPSGGSSSSRSGSANG
jgi:Phage P22-like portal protein